MSKDISALNGYIGYQCRDIYHY